MRISLTQIVPKNLHDLVRTLNVYLGDGLPADSFETRNFIKRFVDSSGPIDRDTLEVLKVAEQDVYTAIQDAAVKHASILQPLSPPARPTPRAATAQHGVGGTGDAEAAAAASATQRSSFDLADNPAAAGRSNSTPGTPVASAFPFKENLPEDLQFAVMQRLPARDAAAFSMTSQQHNRWVEEQPHLRALLLGKSSGPLPQYPHAALNRLVAPYGGLEAARAHIALVHAQGEVLDDVGLFSAGLDLWVAQEIASGTPHGDAQNAARNIREARQSGILDLSGLQIKTLPPVIDRLTTLSELKLQGCTNLTTLPDSIGNLAALTRLILNGCTGLKSLPHSIGNLAALTALALNFCAGLTSLPDSIGNLAALKWLLLTACSRLTALPDSIGDLAGLEILTLKRCTSLTSLPDSIGNLANLNLLELAGCTGLTSLPPSICRLEALSMITVHACTGLTTGSIHAVQAALPRCRVAPH